MAELIHRRGPWKKQGARGTVHNGMGALIRAHPTTQPIAGIPPAEAEANYWQLLVATGT